MRAGTRDFQGSPIIALPWAHAKNNLPSPELWAPYVWVEPSPGPLRRITRNRLFPPSVPNSRSPHTSGHISCFSGSLRVWEASLPSLTLQSVPQVSAPRPGQSTPVCAAPGVGRAQSSKLWLLVAEALRAAAEPTAAPTWDCGCGCCQEPRLPPCIHQFSSVLPPAASVRAGLPWNFPSAGGGKANKGS